MTEKLKAIFNIKNEQSMNITLRICSINGVYFQETFSNNQITIGEIKYLAMKSLLNNCQMEWNNNYKLISIESKRTIDDQKTLKEENVKDGDEYLLAKKISIQSQKLEQTLKSSLIDENLIKQRTEDLQSPLIPSRHPSRRTEFRRNLHGILLSLIETSHKLLWYRSDAEQIFQHVERILSRSNRTINEIEINRNDIDKLIDIGFTEQQARFALKRTKSDLNAAMDFLLTEPIIDDENDNETNLSMHSSYFNRDSFISFRQFRQKYFQPNSIIVQSLQEMGFNREEIIDALRVCHNNQNLACDYLIGDEQTRKNIIDADKQQDLNPNSRLFQAIMENPIVQRAINNPKIFFILLYLYEEPNLITIFLNDSDLSYLFIELTRIHNAQRFESDEINSNSRDNPPENNLIEMLNENS